MSQQVKVYRQIEFEGDADKSANMKGNWNPKKVWFYDDFLGLAVDTANVYNFSTVNSGTATTTRPHCYTSTLGGNDDDDNDLAMGLEWYGQYNATFEARFRNDDVANVGINLGFTDVAGEGGQLIAMAVVNANITSTAADAAVVLIDGDADAVNISAVSVKAGTDGALIDSGVAAADAVFYTARVEFRDNGSRTDALFYVNTSGNEIDPEEDIIGVEFDAVTRTNALCPYIGHIDHEGAANTLDVDYIKIWQDRK